MKNKSMKTATKVTAYLLGAFLALFLAGMAHPRTRDRMTQRIERWFPALQGLLGGRAFFEFAPTDGAGLPSAQLLCDTLTSTDKSGNWWCMNGDGTMATGSMKTMTPAGSPLQTTSTDVVCPNGPSCGSLTSQRYAIGGYSTTTADSDAPNDFSACILFSPDTLSNINFFGKIVGAFPNTSIQWYFQRQVTGRIDFGLINNGGAGTLVTSGTNVVNIGGVHVACGRYHFITDGTSLMQVCVDGNCGTESTTASGPPNNINIATRIGFDASAVYAGRVFGAFQTMKDLGTTRIQEISHAVIADQTKALVSGTEANVTHSRTSGLMFCDSANVNEGSTGSSGSIIPFTRMCISGTKAGSWKAATNNLARSSEFDNATWSKLASGSTIPTYSANAAVAPDGTLTADLLHFYATAPTQYSWIYQAYTPGAVPVTMSIFAKGCLDLSDGGCDPGPLYSAGDGGVLYSDGGVAVGIDGGSGFGTFDLCHNGGSTCLADGGCAFNAYEWRRCKFVIPSFVGSAWVVGNGTAGSGVDRPEQTVQLWGAQGESSAFLTPYVPTGSAAANHGSDLQLFDHGSALPIGCIGSDYWIPNISILVSYPASAITAGDGTASPPLGVIASGGQMKVYAGGFGYTPSGTASTSNRVVATEYVDGGFAAIWDTSISYGISPWGKGTSQYTYIGTYDNTGAGVLNGWVWHLVRDSDVSVCQP